MNEDLDLLVNRLNYDPIAWLGCSQKELMLCCFCVALPACMLFIFSDLVLFGGVEMALVFSPVIVLIGTILSAKLLKRLKRDKEPGYLQQVIRKKLVQFGLIRLPVIRRSGCWYVGRG